jgi:peptidyl-prolyl cis-trans isomerase SurA
LFSLREDGVMKNIFTLLCGIFLMPFLVFAQQEQLIDGVAAVVGNEIVMVSDIEQYVQNYVIQNRLNIRNNPEMFKKLEREVLDKLIEQKIMLTKADEDTIKADDREVDRRVDEHINYLIQQVGTEEKLEEAFQMPIKKIRRNLRTDVADRIKIETLRRQKFSGVKITRQEVETFFKDFQDSIPQLKETVDISHILKQVKAGQSSSEAALAKIKKIKAELDAGADFATLASKYSEDPASAQHGGDLGFTKRGDFVREYEETAYALDEGQISDIVQTQFGYHIIKLVERRGEQIRTSHILIRLTPSEDDEKAVIAELKRIRQEILDGAPFDSMALKYSDDENVKEDKGHLGLWEVDNLALPAFKQVVKTLQPGEISEPFKTEFGYHILKLNSREDARNLSLDTDWEKIQQMALNHKIENEYMKWIDTIKKDIPIEYKIDLN